MTAFKFITIYVFWIHKSNIIKYDPKFCGSVHLRMYSLTHFHAITVEVQLMFVSMMSKADGLSECDREKEEDGRGERGRRRLHFSRRPLRGLAPAGRDTRFNFNIRFR